MNSRILDKLKAIVDQQAETGFVLIFLKHFQLTDYRQLCELYSPLNEQLEVETELPLADMCSNTRPLFKSLLSKDYGVHIGLYEELLLLKDNISGLTEAKIVVIENNLYQGLSPAYYDEASVSALRTLYEDLNSEKITLDEGCFSEIVADFIEIREVPYVSLYDLTKKVDFELIPLVEIGITEVEINDWFEALVELPYQLDDDSDLVRFCNDIEAGELPQGKHACVVEASAKYNTRLAATLSVISELWPEYVIQLYRRSQLVAQTERIEFSQLLERYWGTPNFRNIGFYENPDKGTNKTLISQGVIIESIVTQVEKSLKGEKYQDVFVTAPTGAGKSVLFQIPAIYLAEEHSLLTIVISPLKALMLDQVRQLKEKGIDYVEYINSDLSQIQKQDILRAVQEGKTSILYVSPELLLAYDVRTIIGETRQIGLVVIDEAHLVTTWGRDFRIDYWYLGTYLKKLRDGKYNKELGRFIVAAFTATAVYSGNDDMVFGTIESLYMLNPIKYLGDTRRTNIGFNIECWEKQRSYEEERQFLTLARIKEFVMADRKTIVYAPYRTHVDSLSDSVDKAISNQVVKFHSQVDKDYKQHFEEQFRTGEAKVMIATKAFGMGVDISDIEIVYHHAPTGNLCDYIQEIGRAGRDKNMRGLACQDFNERHDLSYAKVLYGLSGMKLYQLKEVLQKLYRIYLQDRRRNFLVSAESFKYLFPGADDYENKLKNALLLIEKDLQKKYAYPILIVRPKSLFSKAFATVSKEAEKKFKKTPYMEYFKLLQAEEDPQVGPDQQGQYSIYDGAAVYEVDLKRLWEDKFSDRSYPVLKREFYLRTLFPEPYGSEVSPRYRLTFHFSTKNIFDIKKQFNETNEVVREFFSGPVRSQFFTKDDFKSFLKDKGYSIVERRKIADTIIDLFTMQAGEANTHRFLQKRVAAGGRSLSLEDNETYRVTGLQYHRILTDASNRLDNLLQESGFDGEASRFLAIKTEDVYMNLAYILEAYNIAGYDVRGGESPEIFIRINDPYRISTLVAREDRYKNSILNDIKSRQNRSFKILKHFFVTPNTDEGRWDYIENYFLGKIDIE